MESSGGQELNNLNESLSRVSSSAMSAVSNLSQTFDSMNTTFTRSMESMSQAAALLDKFTKKLENVGKTSEKVKRSMSKTWVDVVNSDIIKKLEAEEKAFGRLGSGVDRTTKRLEALKKSVADGVIDENQLKQSLQIMDSMDSQLKSLLDKAKKLNSEGLSLDGAKESIQDVSKLAQQLTLLQMQSVATSKALSGINLDTDPLIAQFREMSDSFSDYLKDMQDEGSKYAKTLQDIFSDPIKSGAASDEDKKRWEDLCKSAEQYGGSLEKAGVALMSSKKTQESLAKLNADRVKQTQKVADLEMKANRARAEKAGKGGLMGILSGFQSGGLMGGLSAMGGARDNKIKSILENGSSSAEKLKLAKSMGLNVTQGKDGEYQIQSSFSQVAGRLARNGLKGLGEEGGLGGFKIKNDGSIKALEGLTRSATSSASSVEGLAVGAGEAAVGVEGVAAGAAGAEGAIAGMGGGASAAAAALGPLAIVAAALMGVFKIYSAVMDHAAKNYREVRAFGGVSGILGQGKPGDLENNARKFRRNLVSGGGGALDPYFLTFEKKMSMLGAAQSAGLNAGRMQDEVRSSKFTDKNVESGTLVGTYMQTAAQYAELFGKDLKEASAEMANLHEEVSMSFESIDKFMMNISKSATAAGISNEKFLKITRSLANEQNTYGVSLQSTSRILQVLGQSGAYTSETLKKAFESLRGNDQNISQKVFAAHQLMGNPATLAGVKSSVNSQLQATTSYRDALQKKLSDNTLSEDKKDDLRKELNNLNLAIPRLQVAQEALAKGDTTKFASVIGDLPDQIKHSMTTNQIANLPGNSAFGELLQNGASAEELRKGAESGRFITDLMTKLLGLPSISENINAQLQLLEGSTRASKKLLFGNGETAGADQKAYIEKNKGSLTQALKAAGVEDGDDDKITKLLEGISNGTVTAAEFQAKLYDSNKIGTKTFTKMAAFSQKLVELGLGSEQDIASMKDLLGLSAQKATDTSEKIKAWAEPLLQTGNSWLDNIASIMMIKEKPTWDKVQKERTAVKRTETEAHQSEKVDQASHEVFNGHNKLLELAHKFGVSTKAYTNKQKSGGSAEDLHTQIAFIASETKKAALNKGDKESAAQADQIFQTIEKSKDNYVQATVQKGFVERYRSLGVAPGKFNVNTGIGSTNLFNRVFNETLKDSNGQYLPIAQDIVKSGFMTYGGDKKGYELSSKFFEAPNSKRNEFLSTLPPLLAERLKGMLPDDAKLEGKNSKGDTVTIQVDVKNINTSGPGASRGE